MWISLSPLEIMSGCADQEAIDQGSGPDGRTLFPGITGEVTSAGEGRNSQGLQRACWESTEGFGDGMIDMGSGAKIHILLKTHKHAWVADTGEEFERYEQQKKNKALRWATQACRIYRSGSR